MDTIGKFSAAACLTEQSDHLLLYGCDPTGRVAPARLQPAYFYFTALKNTKIAVGNRDARVGFGRQKSHPAIDTVQVDGQPGVQVDLADQIGEVFRSIAAFLFDPECVHVHV